MCTAMCQMCVDIWQKSTVRFDECSKLPLYLPGSSWAANTLCSDKRFLFVSDNLIKTLLLQMMTDNKVIFSPGCHDRLGFRVMRGSWREILDYIRNCQSLNIPYIKLDLHDVSDNQNEQAKF